MNMKSEKGALTILFALMVAFFIAVLFLGLHKNISSFIDMEQKQKKDLSQNKIKHIVLKSLENFEACSNTFSQTGEFVTSIKNLYNKEVLKLSVSNKDFYRKSLFYEKTGGFRITKIKIREENPKNFDTPPPDPPINMDCYQYPPGENIEHCIATLEMTFFKAAKPSDKEFQIYEPIYIRKKSGSLESCSTAEVAVNRLHCKSQSTEIICCRYKYKLTLDPDDSKFSLERPEDGFPIREQPYVVQAKPGDPEQVDFVKTSKDPKGKEIDKECKKDKNNARLEGLCTYAVNWVLETSCE